jgi:hypothetical protein
MQKLTSRTAAAITAIASAATLAACGSSGGGGVTVPKVAPARVFSISGFQPAAPVKPRQPVTVSFTVQMPNGKPLTSYRTGSGPHTGVHLIIVRDDLAYIVHEHPPVGANGLLQQTVTFPAPGPYHVLVDIYPNLPGVLPNFQLTQSIDVSGHYHPQSLPPFSAHQVVDGYHFDVQGRPHLHAIQAQFMHVDVSDPHGRRVTFVPWFGALAHAIFFQQSSLNYFHTHICAPSAPNCGSLPGVRATAITGSSSAPGKLTIGVLLAEPGTWRLFLQAKLGGRVVTAPFTLNVKP